LKTLKEQALKGTITRTLDDLRKALMAFMDH